MIRKAQERDEGQMNKRSFMKGEGNFVGFLGEYMVESIRSDFKHVDSFDYDFSCPKGTVDVKTKHQTVPFEPRGDYEASVDVNSMHQRVDYYIFCRVFKDKTGQFKHGWILGGISKKEFLEKARRLKKGDQDGDNGYIVKQDCYNLRYDQLKNVKKK